MRGLRKHLARRLSGNGRGLGKLASSKVLGYLLIMPKEPPITWPERHAWMHDYLIRKPGAIFERKKSWNALLYRLHGKIFAFLLYHTNGEPLVNVKCNPFISIEFREACVDVRPGWHMNKLHWLSMHLDGDVPREIAEELLDISYELILAGLPARLRKGLGVNYRHSR